MLRRIARLTRVKGTRRTHLGCRANENWRTGDSGYCDISIAQIVHKNTTHVSHYTCRSLNIPLYICPRKLTTRLLRHQTMRCCTRQCMSYWPLILLHTYIVFCNGAGLILPLTRTSGALLHSGRTLLRNGTMQVQGAVREGYVDCWLSI